MVATRLCLAGAQPEFDFLRFSFYSEGREERERRATKSKSDGGMTFWGGCALWPLIKSEDLRSRRQSVADQRFVPAQMRPLSGLALLLKFFLMSQTFLPRRTSRKMCVYLVFEVCAARSMLFCFLWQGWSCCTVYQSGPLEDLVLRFARIVSREAIRHPPREQARV